MKTLSLWQPWASAMAIGSKSIETRSWVTTYRGPVVIHAAKRCNKNELIDIACHWGWKGALRPFLEQDHYLWKVLPFGALLSVGNLVDIRPTESFTQGEILTRHRADGEKTDLYDWTQKMLGDFGLDRFGWIFRGMRCFAEPISLLGHQGLFNVPDHIIPEEFRRWPWNAPV